MSVRARSLLAVGLLLLVGLGAFGWTFVRRPLPVPETAGPLPPPARVPGVALERIPTARIPTQLGLSVRGGSVLEPQLSVMTAFVVRHPNGTLLIDAGLGRRAAEHLATAPFTLRAVVDLELEQGLGEGLEHAGIDPSELFGVIPTHAHWDHVSGLDDIPGVAVWLTEAEQAYTREDDGAAAWRLIDAAQPVDVRTLRFDDGPFGPFPASWDVFDDGVVVVVPLEGHTPGSVGVFLSLPSGVRYLFVGDTSWTAEGVAWPAEKPWVSRRLVDADRARVVAQLGLLNRLAAENPELVVVPAHEPDAHTSIPVAGAPPR